MNKDCVSLQQFFEVVPPNPLCDRNKKPGRRSIKPSSGISAPRPRMFGLLTISSSSPRLSQNQIFGLMMTEDRPDVSMRLHPSSNRSFVSLPPRIPLLLRRTINRSLYCGNLPSHQRKFAGRKLIDRQMKIISIATANACVFDNQLDFALPIGYGFRREAVSSAFPTQEIKYGFG
jgi:hypothetical protein